MAATAGCTEKIIKCGIYVVNLVSRIAYGPGYSQYFYGISISLPRFFKEQFYSKK